MCLKSYFPFVPFVSQDDVSGTFFLFTYCLLPYYIFSLLLVVPAGNLL